MEKQIMLEHSISILKYKDKDDNIVYRATYVNNPYIVSYSAYYMYKAFCEEPEWKSFSLADVHATRLEEMYPNDIEYGTLFFNIDMTWEDLEDYAEEELNTGDFYEKKSKYFY